MLFFVVVVVLAGAIAPLEARFDPNCDGKKVIVHLFNWAWDDIANECEQVLAPKGYCGAQISPPQEHPIVADRPWWERYQPVSYKLVSRSGDEAALRSMIERCNNVGVRIFPDIIINHMTGTERSGTGNAGTSFNGGTFDFPGVPYSLEDFNNFRCDSSFGNNGDLNNIRNCRLLTLADLNQERPNVREKIAEFLNNLIDMGVAGFRFDASKHMWPTDIEAIFGMLHNLNTQWFSAGATPFMMHEVVDYNDGAVHTQDYADLGYVTEFRYCKKLAAGINDFGQFNNVVDLNWGMTQSDRALVFLDNHDNQRDGDAPNYKDPRRYKLGVAFMLAYPYGFTRVMSSFAFTNRDAGPPHNADESIKAVPYHDGIGGDGWVCEHRWRPIANMVAFRNYVGDSEIGNWYNQNDEVAFSRGNKGFFAMAKNGRMDATLDTGLPQGDYCNLIDDCATRVSVGGDGRANIRITDNDAPILAIITGDPPTGGTPPPGSHTTRGQTQQNSPDITTGQHRTVIFVQKQTIVGQDMFIRGGIDHNRRAGCTYDVSSSACAISITHRHTGTSSYYAKYAAWATGDTKLDWYGAESGQGSYQGAQPAGTPALWTTNTGSGEGVNSMNTYGAHYWMVDVDMNCGDTDNGWFEVKAVVNGVWETDINTRQGQSCGGTAGGQAPQTSINHMARCGYINIFTFSSNRCTVNAF